MLACPRCREALRPVAMLGGFLWAGPTCGGRAGTLALLRHRTPRAALTALREAARAAGQGGGGGTPYLGLGSEGESAWVADDARSCPSCARPLPRVAVPAHGIAEALDVCPRCDLVWFERTTMSALPLRPTLPAGPRPYPPRLGLAPQRTPPPPLPHRPRRHHLAQRPRPTVAVHNSTAGLTPGRRRWKDHKALQAPAPHP